MNRSSAFTELSGMGLEDDDKPEDKGDKLDYDVNAAVKHLKNNAHENLRDSARKLLEKHSKLEH